MITLPEELIRPSDRPLLIVDADEVLLQFVAGLEAFFNRLGFDLRLQSFQLTGNIYRVGSDTPLSADEVQKLISRFFVEDVEKLVAVPDAAENLAAINEKADIVILSNVPTDQHAARLRNLRAQGFDYPLIASHGGKGQFVRALAHNRGHFVGFVDDLPPQHVSVAEHAPHVHRLHFVADPRLQTLLDRAPDAHHRIDDWTLARQHLLTEMDRYGRAVP